MSNNCVVFDCSETSERSHELEWMVLVADDLAEDEDKMEMCVGDSGKGTGSGSPREENVDLVVRSGGSMNERYTLECVYDGDRKMRALESP